jgi:hypothetical protein
MKTKITIKNEKIKEIYSSDKNAFETIKRIYLNGVKTKYYIQDSFVCCEFSLGPTNQIISRSSDALALKAFKRSLGIV